MKNQIGAKPVRGILLSMPHFNKGVKMLFRDYLKEKRIAESRIPALNYGFSMLHASLAELDYRNIKIISTLGLGHLLHKFSELENVRRFPEI